MSLPTPFHRIFGYSWINFFDGTDIQVETEVDLSIKLQLLDLQLMKALSPDVLDALKREIKESGASATV